MVDSSRRTAGPLSTSRKILLFLVPVLFLALSASAQDMKSFSFHVDSTSGNGTENDITGLTLIGVTLTGSSTSNRAIVFEVADSIGTFSSLKCTNIDSLVVVSTVTLSGSAPLRFQCPVGGFKKFRVRISGGSTGTLTAVGLGLAKAGASNTRGTSGGGGGPSTSIILDLGNSGPVESTSLGEIATAGDVNSIFTLPSTDKLLIDATKKWPSASIADAFSANPANCPAGQAAGGINASGAAEDCFSPGGGGGSSSFNAITSGTNTSASMLCGAGCSLGPTSSGIVSANALSGAITIPTGSSLAPSGSGTITATTANALSANPAACGANNFVIDIDANGTLTCAQPASSSLSDASNIVTLAGNQTLFNKEVVPREVVMVPTGSNEIEPNCAAADIVAVNALSANLTVKNPLCTPKPSQEIDFRFFCSAQRLIFWGNKFSITAGVPLLNVCTGDGSTFDYIKYRWNSINSFWESVAVKATGKGVATLASNTTFTPPADVASRVEMQMTAVSGTLTVAAPSPSTPANGDLMWLAFQCTNLQTFAWNAIYKDGIYQTRPTTCPANLNTFVEVLVRYSSVETGWIVLVGASATAGITVQEIDGTPTGTFTTLKFSNGSMTDNGGGVATIVTSGSSSFTVTKNLPITGVKFPTTNPARLDRSLAFDRLLFNDTTQQCAIWQFIWPSDYTSGGSLKIIYSMLSDTNAAHNLAFDVSFKAITPGDATTIITKAFSGTANNCDDSAIPSVAQRPDVITCTLTNTDSVAAGDLVQIQLCRDVASDNSTGDAEVEGVELSYVH